MVFNQLTLVHQLNSQADRLKDRPALWHRRAGRWQATSWRQYAQRVRHLALGLLSLGFGPGQTLLVLASSREEWLVSALGAMAVGGRFLGVDPDSSPEQVASMAADAGATMAVVEHQPMLARVGPSLASALGHIVLIEPAVDRSPRVSSFAEVLELGASGDDADFYACLGALKGEEVAELAWERGAPRAVMLTHKNLAWTAAQLGKSFHVAAEDALVSQEPLSSITEQLAAVLVPVSTGAQVYFGRGVVEEFLEVRPTLFFGGPRLWEALKARSEEVLAEQNRSLQGLLAKARAVAKRAHLEFQRHQPTAVGLKSQYALARRLALGPLKERLGLDRGRLFVATAPVSRELLEYFASIDVVVAEAYGHPCVTGVASLSTPDAVKFGAQGRPMLGVEVRVEEDGEVLVRGENVCAGYLNDEAATQTLLRGGWLHTGDRGALDEEGFLTIAR